MLKWTGERNKIALWKKTAINTTMYDCFCVEKLASYDDVYPLQIILIVNLSGALPPFKCSQTYTKSLSSHTKWITNYSLFNLMAKMSSPLADRAGNLPQPSPRIF